MQPLQQIISANFIFISIISLFVIINTISKKKIIKITLQGENSLCSILDRLKLNCKRSFIIVRDIFIMKEKLFIKSIP